MNYKPIYEFLLWDNCNNRCQFCFQRENPRLFNKDKREMILNKTLEFIESDTFIKGSHILVCGGEIFDKPSDYEMLHTFFSKIIEHMLNDVIDILYINTNLIYKDLTGVIDFLTLIKDNKLLDRIRFTTSYDLAGRFRDKETELTMLNNLKTIRELFKDMGIVVNTILTKQVCEAIINKTFDITKFMKEYNCWVNLLPYIVLDKSLTPTRSQIIKTLKLVDQENEGYLNKYVPNMSITQEKWLYMYKNDEFQFCSCELAECGHSVNFKRYSDKGTCFCCDLKEIFNGEI